MPRNIFNFIPRTDAGDLIFTLANKSNMIVELDDIENVTEELIRSRILMRAYLTLYNGSIRSLDLGWWRDILNIWMSQ